MKTKGKGRVARDKCAVEMKQDKERSTGFSGLKFICNLGRCSGRTEGQKPDFNGLRINGQQKMQKVGMCNNSDYQPQNQYAEQKKPTQKST